MASELTARVTVRRARALIGFFGFGIFWGSWGVLLPALGKQARVGDGGLGVAVLMVGLGALCSMRVAGALIDRVGRGAVTGCVLAMAVAGLLPAFARSGGELAASLALLGIASGAMDVAINTAATAEEARSGAVMNAAHACFSAAVVVAGLATGFALGAGATVVTILGCVSMTVASGALVLHFLGPAPTLTCRRQHVSDRDRVRVSTRLLLVLGALCALAYLVENAWQSWSALLLRESFHADARASAGGPVLFACAAAFGRAAGHRFQSRMDRLRLLAAGASVAAAGSVVAALAPSLAWALVGIAVAGLGTSVCAPTILSLAGERAKPGARSSVVALVTTIGYGGFLIGPAAVGLTAAASSLRTALVCVGLVALTLSISAIAVRSNSGY